MTLLLLHGLGANAGVWAPVYEGWAGPSDGRADVLAGPAADGAPSWLAPDLPGHGAAAHRAGYGYDEVADDLAARLADLVPAAEPLDVIGHSYGGVLGLLLATRRPVRSLLTVGMRVVWPAEFEALLAGLAGKPHRAFPDREAAAAFLLRINGVTDWLDADSELVRRGLVQGGDGQWRAGHDARALGVRRPAYEELLAAAVAGGTTLTLAHGAADDMVAPGDYDDLLARSLPATDRSPQASGADGPPPVRVVALAGLGHNAHVEDPAAVLALLRPGTRPT